MRFVSVRSAELQENYRPVKNRQEESILCRMLPDFQEKIVSIERSQSAPVWGEGGGEREGWDFVRDTPYYYHYHHHRHRNHLHPLYAGYLYLYS